MCPTHMLLHTFIRSIFCLCLHAPGVTNAAIIDNGHTTIDTSTNLEWLDLTETVGISYLVVQHETAPGGRFESYRHASEQEALNIFFNIFDGQGGPANEHHLRFLELFGVTSPGFYGDVYGYVNPGKNYDKVPGKDYYVVPVYGLNNLNYEGTETFIVNRGQLRHNPSLAYSGFGNYLVRDHDRALPVPEIDSSSAPLAMALLLLLCLLIHERRLNSREQV